MMNEQNENLIADFKKSIFEDNTGFFDDLIEARIDSFLSDGVIKDIPILNSLKTLSISIFNYNAMKKTYIF